MNGVEDVSAKKRKIRSDKKRDVKPTVLISLKTCIYRLSYITSTPVKEIIELICLKGLKSKKVIDYLSGHFRRDYHMRNTIYIGDPKRESLQRKKQPGETSRITSRFTQTTHDDIAALAFALDVSISKGTALLLDASIKNTNIINAIVKKHLYDQLDEGRVRELKKVLKFVSENNPYCEEISWFALLSIIFDDIKDGATNIKDSIHNWIDKYK